MRFPAYIQHFSINKWGFNGKDFSETKDSGTYRIILLGSSDECGLFTDGPLNYPLLLEQSLRRAGHKVEVLNLAIDGPERSMRNIRMATGECLRYQPDLILLKNSFPLTDDIRTKYRSSYKGIEIKYAHPETLDSARVYIDEHIEKKQLQHYVIDYCYIYRFLIRANFKYNIPLLRKLMINTYDSYVYWGKNLWWSETMDKRIYKAPIYTPLQTIEILKATKAKMDSNKVDFVIYNTYRVGRIKMFNELFSKNGIKYWGLEVPHNEEYSFGEMDGHTTQIGHVAIAKTLTDSVAALLQKRHK
jgi:hypothetical protein